MSPLGVKADVLVEPAERPELAICGRLPGGKGFLDGDAVLVGAIICSACCCGALRWPLAIMLSADRAPSPAKRDQGPEIRQPGCEALGAIDGIQHPKILPVEALHAMFFAEYPVVGKALLDPGTQLPLNFLIERGDGRTVALDAMRVIRAIGS